jgi:hypothetical protein
MFVVKKENVMINLICQATWIANLFRIKQNIKFYGFLYFGLHIAKFSSEVSRE